MKTVVFIVALLLVGCGVNPQRVRPVEPRREIAAATCEQIAGEKAAIEHSVAARAGSHRAGTREAIAELLGEASDVNEQAILHGCDMRPVNLPTSCPMLVRRKAVLEQRIAAITPQMPEQSRAISIALDQADDLNDDLVKYRCREPRVHPPRSWNAQAN